MCPYLHHERDQLIQSCLFNPFHNNKLHFCFVYYNNAGKPLVLFIYSHYVPLIIFFKKMLKTRQLGNINYYQIQPAIPNPTSLVANLFIKTFYKGLPERKGKLNMVTSTVANIYPVVRSFGSSSIIGCSKRTSVTTKSFESYSELDSSSLEMKVLQKKFLLMN